MTESQQLLGEILLRERLIDQSDLLTALEAQGSCQKRVGEILIQNGAATQNDILAALAIQLRQRTVTQNQSRRFRPFSRYFLMRVPIRFKLLVLISTLILLIMLASSSFLFHSEKTASIQQMIRLGSVVTGNLANNCAVPLLENDDAALNMLLEQIARNEEVAYALIVNKAETVVAHSHVNAPQLNHRYTPPAGAQSLPGGDGLEIRSIIEGERELLDFSLPITFSKVLIGSVHVGISLVPLQKQIAKARLFAALLTLVLLVAGVVAAYYLSRLFSQPIADLVKGTREIKNGHLAYRIQPISNDELGDLTTAFNDMADGLMTKEVIQEAFGRYVTPELVDKILSNPDEKWFKGQRVTATVLFADIRGFTALSEKIGPEEVVGLLNEYFSLATEIILRHGGHVDKFIGDEILAVFGTLVRNEDHALRAVRAAMELQQSLCGKSYVAVEGGTMAIDVGIGINSGEVIAGNIGSHRRMEYTVIGDTVNLASRLTHLAAAGEIIVSEPVRAAVATAVAVEALKPVAVKGKSQLQQIYRVPRGVVVVDVQEVLKRKGEDDGRPERRDAAGVSLVQPR